MPDTTLFDRARIERRRINSNPTLSLRVYQQLKRDDAFDLGVTREELANALLRIALAFN